MSFLLYFVLLFPNQAPVVEPAAPAAVADAPTTEAKPSEDQTAKPAEQPAENAEIEATPVDTGKTFADVLEDLSKTGAMGFMFRGGIFMWPILFSGILAAGVLIERYRTLKMVTTDTSALRNNVRQLLIEDRVEEAMRTCEQETGPVPAILSSGLRKFLILKRLKYDPSKIEDQVVKAMEDYSVHVVAALEKHLPILATVSSVAPMLGFLGTVSGMITSFDDIVAASKAGNTNIVEASAAGIAEALLTTLLGLVVGIPAFSGYNYFTGVINRFVLDVEESSSELIETVTQQMTLEQQATDASGQDA
jgi:biopolymer transport protein ExbB